MGFPYANLEMEGRVLRGNAGSSSTDVRTDVQAKTEGNRLKSTTCGPRECDAQQVVRPDGALYTCMMDR